jgi:hypothetical protein
MSHLNPETLARLVDDAPDPAERTHLEACGACRQELEDMRADLAALQALPAIEPPPSHWQKLERQLAAEGLLRRPRMPLSWQAAAMRAAAAILVFLLGGAAGAAWMGERTEPGIMAAVDPNTTVLDPRIVPQPIERIEPETRAPVPPPVRSAARSGPGVLPVTDNILTAALLSGRMPQTRDEATVFLSEAEALYMAALDRLANLGPDATTGDPLTRIAALEGIVAITRAALGRAPADPVLNGYHITAIAQREAALRQLASTTGGNWF